MPPYIEEWCAVFRKFMIQYRDNSPIHEPPWWDLPNRVHQALMWHFFSRRKRCFHFTKVVQKLGSSLNISSVIRWCLRSLYSGFSTIYYTICIYLTLVHVHVHFPILLWIGWTRSIYQLVTDMKLCFLRRINHPYIAFAEGSNTLYKQTFWPCALQKSKISLFFHKNIFRWHTRYDMVC